MSSGKAVSEDSRLFQCNKIPDTARHTAGRKEHDMPFTPINTQEEFDAAIGERLKRERETLEKKFEGYTSPDDLAKLKGAYDTKVSDLNKSLEDAKTKIAGHDKTVAELNAKIRGYETDSAKTRIALEEGLSFEFAQRLTGEDEEAIRKDAKAFAAVLKKQKGGMPPSSHEGGNGSARDKFAEWMAQANG